MYSTFDLEFTDMFSPILAKLSKDVVFRINKEVLEQTWYPSVALFQSENVHCLNLKMYTVSKSVYRNLFHLPSDIILLTCCV